MSAEHNFIGISIQQDHYILLQTYFQTHWFVQKIKVSKNMGDRPNWFSEKKNVSMDPTRLEMIQGLRKVKSLSKFKRPYLQRFVIEFVSFEAAYFMQFRYRRKKFKFCDIKLFKFSLSKSSLYGFLCVVRQNCARVFGN